MEKSKFYPLQTSNEVYTSNLAESTVNTLINDRQKGKQKMLWGRDGAHNVLQIRASVFHLVASF